MPTIFSVTVVTDHTFTPQDIADLCATAIDNAHWLAIEKRTEPDMPVPDNAGWANAEGKRYWYLTDLPAYGGNVVITAPEYGDIGYDGVTEWVLDGTTVLAGLETLAKDYPKKLARIIHGDYDAADADCWLQCAIWGDIILD